MIDVSAPNYPQDEAKEGIDMTSMYETLPYFPTTTTATSWHQVQKMSAMQEIIPGVFLGPYSSAQRNCLKNLLDNGIRYIVCVRQEVDAHFIRPQITDPSFTYLTLDIADHDTIISFFPRVKQFIDDALAKNCKVLVHGNTGNSTSATLVLAYIMEKFGLNTNEAYVFVKEKRASINLKEGFFAQLAEYEPIYKARQTLDNGEPSCDNRRQKRKSEQLCESVDYDLIQPPPSPISENNNQEDFMPAKDFSNNLYKLWLLKHS